MIIRSVLIFLLVYSVQFSFLLFGSPLIWQVLSEAGMSPSNTQFCFVFSSQSGKFHDEI